MTPRTEQEKLIKIFEDCGAILHGHFVYTSGRHGKVYVNKDAIYPHKEIHKLCTELVGRYWGGFFEADAIVAPLNGGAVLSRLVADALMRHLSRMKLQNQRKRKVLAIYAEKTADGKDFVIRRGYDKLIAGKNVVVVDDVMTTGGSVKKVVRAARNCGANVYGVAVLWDRWCGDYQQFCEETRGVFLARLIKHQFSSWEEADCPLCKSGVPVNTEVGKGGEFYIRKMERDIVAAANRAAAEVLGGKKK